MEGEIDKFEAKEVGDLFIDLKKLCVPDHMLCLISQDLMTDPVTIESGKTYERANIVQYFEMRK